MSEQTKACNLTSDEITALIMVHAGKMDEGSISERIERINYFHKRLKAFNDPVGEAVASTAGAAGWGTNNG